MTPCEYLRQLRFLVHSFQNAEAMAFVERWAPGVYPYMTAQEDERATTLLELPVSRLKVEARRAAAGLPEMQPAEYLRLLRMLVRAGQHTEAQAFAERRAPSVFPLMTPAERQQATGTLGPPPVSAVEGWRPATLDGLLNRWATLKATTREPRRRDLEPDAAQ